jgi:hypothetical protein
MMLPNSPSPPDPYLAVPDLIDGAPFFIYEGFKGNVAGCVVSYGKGLGFRDMTRY